MKSHVAQNADKSRYAVVGGRKVLFYLRHRRADSYSAPRQVWHETYATRADAIKAADIWAAGGGVMRPERRAS